MTEPPPDDEIGSVYLALDDALELHGLIIGASSDEASDQLRSRDGLESALGRPAFYAHYESADLPLQAAVLAHGISEGQFFVDGNKRTALVAMLTFLEINGLGVRASDPELADWILRFSDGAIPGEVAALIRAAAFPIQ